MRTQVHHQTAKTAFVLLICFSISISLHAGFFSWLKNIEFLSETSSEASVMALAMATITDDFSSENYSGGTPIGPGGWLTDWTETNDDGTFTNGAFEIASGELEMQGTSGATVRFIERTVDVTAAGTASWSFDWRVPVAMESEDYFKAQYSINGGANFVDLMNRDGVDLTSTASATENFLIPVSTTNALIIRFEYKANVFDELTLVDNIEVVTDPSPCSLNITNVVSQNCVESTPNTFIADWEIEIEVTGEPDNAISYQRNSDPIQSHTLIGTTASLGITGIPADGGAYDTLKVWFTNDLTCANSIIVQRPIPCPPTISGSGPGEICSTIDATTIAGSAFEDYDFNGDLNQRDTTGVQAIEVQLFDCDNNLVGTTYTDANGNYQFTGVNSGDEYRIEFILPDYLSSVANSSITGPSNGTTVQFVQAGSCANLGLIYPGICPPPFDFTTPLGTPFPLSGTLAGPGITLVTCGVFLGVPTADRWAAGLMDMRSIPYDATRSQVVPPMYHHPSWHVDSIGNTYGLDFDSLGYMYVSASTHFGAGYGYQGDTSIIRFGDIGGGAEDVNAAGTVYRFDAFTGQASVFSVLPQQAVSYVHESCESSTTFPRNTGVGLGNLVYDKWRHQFFVSNFEDGKIYRLDYDGNILNSFDPQTLPGFTVDNGLPGTPADAMPYGLAISPDGSNLFFGTHELDTIANLYSVALATDGDFSGTETYHGEFKGEGDIGYTFASEPSWISIADLEFLPNGNLMIGIRTGCEGTYFSSHNHGGNFHIVESAGGDGLYNDLVINPDLQYFNDDTSNDDGYGGIGVYSKHDGTWDYVLSSADIVSEPGPHGLIVFPHDFTHAGDGITTYTLQPSAAISYFPSLSPNDIKGVGGDVAVFNGCNILFTEIGSRIWLDANEDGIQDACEAGIENVRIELYDNTGNLLAFDTTDANGNYYFSSAADSNQHWLIPDGKLSSLTDYYVLVGNQQFQNDTLKVDMIPYTLTADSTDSGLNRYVIDSDAEVRSDFSGGLVVLNGFPVTKVTTGDFGSADHSFDFGFIEIRFYDKGDLPDLTDQTAQGDYQTLDSNNGPTHLIINGLTLGSLIDNDSVGQQSTLANGDDLNGDDEDGLQLQSNIQFVQNGIVKIPLSVTNTTSDTAHIEMWIDWNGNGDFDDTNEMVADLNDGNGTTPFPSFLTLNIPEDATQDQNLGLRIRLSNEDDMTPYGLINSGEVEDYIIQVTCKEACLELSMGSTTN